MQIIKKAKKQSEDYFCNIIYFSIRLILQSWSIWEFYVSSSCSVGLCGFDLVVAQLELAFPSWKVWWHWKVKKVRGILQFAIVALLFPVYQ